uniref:ABC transporter ATP-binding protein n=1 Tax=candidate division CPR3 bacterium TaxID=2268181 RepID=A0A7C5UVE9_UNCC3
MLIDIIDVYKKYTLNKHEVNALNGVSLKIKEGEFVIVFGPSGSGKSTLLSIIGALDKPTSGEVFIDGENISRMSDKKAARFRRSNIGFVFQAFNLLPFLTAEENVALPLLFSGIGKVEAIKLAREVLESLDMGERARHKPSELSGGEAQRVAIARAVVCKPKIILADEPTGNLDSKTAVSVMNLLRQLNKKGHTVIVVTHERSFLKFGNRIVHILDGKIRSDERRI